MAEDFGDKTEAPTPRRRQEARSHGNIARSPDLAPACLLIGMMILLNSYGGGLVQVLKKLMGEMLSAHELADLQGIHLGQGMLNAICNVGLAMWPIFAGLMLIAIFVNLAQVGLFFNLSRLQPNFAALNPVRGFGKLFNRGDGAVHLLMNFLKLVLVSLTAYSAIHGRITQIVTVQQLNYIQILGLASSLVYAIAIRIGVLLLVLAIFDYAWQKYRHEKDLKMSKQEVKEEMRAMDGDPKIKNRRRQIQMQIARERLKKDVPTADVIVTNPTHYAVALKYDPSTMSAPRVVAKGQGAIAQRIREIAIASGIPILERKPLARALYRLVEVGHEVPEQFYSAIAEILAYVYELGGKVRLRKVI